MIFKERSKLIFEETEKVRKNADIFIETELGTDPVIVLCRKAKENSFFGSSHSFFSSPLV